ncbi:glycoside hydrolase family protein [Candidatus Pacearchaeota archaeon]|jgi:GH24 family phage-related lysozyme (muramidase)|nr:glycoside hydrolase family protein [Candidatus Pacearchaeota archaeon]
MTIDQMLAEDEGRKKKKYRCTGGAWTIGIGWNLDANPLPADIDYYLKQNGKITDDMIDRLLDISIRHATADCHVLFPEFKSFTPARQMALINFVFQLGYRRALTFRHAIAAINTGRWADAANEMRASQWYAQTQPSRRDRVIEFIEEG